MKLENDTRSRKWQITINNPLPKGYTHDIIQENLCKFKGLLYFCLADEIGNLENTFHTHVFCVFKNAVKFSVMQKKFGSDVHYEMCKGSCVDNRDYIFKEGKWIDDLKGETNLRDTHVEYGNMPIEIGQGQRTDLIQLYDMISQGFSNAEILAFNPDYITKISDIDKARLVILQNKYKKVWRDLDVTYIYGKTGSGKTRYVMEKHGYENVYRVTNYKNPFDTYMGQDVVLFDEFRSSLNISDMLKYLDGYPVLLPSRYSDKVACFSKVYFTSNISLDLQYVDVQKSEVETYKAFLRRIHHVYRKDNLDDCCFFNVSDEVACSIEDLFKKNT